MAVTEGIGFYWFKKLMLEMGLAKIQYFFRALATKSANESYIAKVAVRIEQIFKENNIDPRTCFFVVTGEEDRDPVTFIFEKRTFYVRKFAEITAPHKLEQNLALLGHALTECGVTLKERIWVTGFAVKHLSKDNPKRKLIYMIRAQVRSLRQRYNLMR